MNKAPGTRGSVSMRTSFSTGPVEHEAVGDGAAARQIARGGDGAHASVLRLEEPCRDFERERPGGAQRAVPQAAQEHGDGCKREPPEAGGLQSD